MGPTLPEGLGCCMEKGPEVPHWDFSPQSMIGVCGVRERGSLLSAIHTLREPSVASSCQTHSEMLRLMAGPDAIFVAH